LNQWPIWNSYLHHFRDCYAFRNSTEREINSFYNCVFFYHQFFVSLRSLHKLTLKIVDWNLTILYLKFYFKYNDFEFHHPKTKMTKYLVLYSAPNDLKFPFVVEMGKIKKIYTERSYIIFSCFGTNLWLRVGINYGILNICLSINGKRWLLHVWVT